MRITVVGCGYVGLVTGACLAEMGNDVICVDVDPDKVSRLNQGEIPIYEPGLSEMIVRNQRRISFTNDLPDSLATAQICFIAVGTPPDQDGAVDLRQVREAAMAVGMYMTGPLTVAIKSTVPVGTNTRVKEIIGECLARRRTSWEYDVVSNPEFLKEGKAIEDFMRPDRIVVGAHNDAGFREMRNLYSHFIRNGHGYLEMDPPSAEFTKYAANVMLATRISLMNEFALICEHVGADIMQVRRGIGTDSRIGMSYIYAGAGFGGSCLPKDVKALSRMAIDANCPADILDAVNNVNQHQKVLLANRVIDYFQHDVKKRQIAVWGLAFKPKTDDIREAPALTIIKRLLGAGARVCAYDPEATENVRALYQNEPNISFTNEPYEALANAEALLLVTEWALFRKPDFERMKSMMQNPVIFDGRNQYEPAEMQKLGFEYYCIGRHRA